MTPFTFSRITVVLLLLLLKATWTGGKPQQIKPGCRYEGRRYQEGASVITSEPCLQCRCTEGALRCRLRVCPRLPNPPPAGCTIRSPGENVCCAELTCGDSREIVLSGSNGTDVHGIIGDTENKLRRSNVPAEEEEPSIEDRQFPHSEGCVHEGVRYGPGSAMMGSRRCEYCYCISGARRCIRPKCLLPLPGCTPLYAPHFCCPVAYNCTHLHSSTLAPLSGNGCRVGERTYSEGEMVREIEWKAACDNCFCAMGAVRCVPLACAPPLQGCSPIVREGHCCPSTYNCSGSIEVKATQNYASYAFISKDYAKFRKETNFFPTLEQSTNPSVEGRGHRVVEECVEGGTTDLQDESSIGTDSTPVASTLDTDPMDNEILVETLDYAKSTLEITATTPLPLDEATTASNTETTPPNSALLTKEEDYRADPLVEHLTTTPAEFTATVTEEGLSTMNITTTASLEFTTIPFELIANNSAEDLHQEVEEETANVIERNKITTYPSPVNATIEDLVAKTEETGTLTLDISTVDPIQLFESTVKEPVSKPSSSILMPDDVLVMNVTVKTNVSVGHIQGVTINPIRSIPPDVEAILNITQREKGEEYEYDYSEPTLPPSLPNVRIIPFVAADALVKDKSVSSSVTGYPTGSVVVPPELRPTDTSGFYEIATQENRFSPPVETEGGFVPREPPPYFDPSYHSTDLNLEIGTGVTVVPAAITNPHRKNDANSCLFENVEYRHGEILPSATICVICMCYYGEVVCSTEKCSPLKIGCRRINVEEQCCGNVVCVDADESPTVVLDRADATAPSLHQPMVSPDPFRDVIKTEPAPDLPSLIEDMIPYLVEHGITTPRTGSSTTPTKPIQSQGANHQQHPTNFGFMEKLSLIPPPFDYRGDAQDLSISKKKYGASQETPVKDQNNFTFMKESVNKKPGSPLEIIPDIRPYEYDRIPLTKGDLATSKFEDLAFVPVNVSEASTQRPKATSEVGLKSAVALKTHSTPLPAIDTDHPTTTTEDTSANSEDDPIFSLDNVLDLLFFSDTKPSGDTTPTTIEPADSVSGSDQDPSSSSTSTTTIKSSTERGSIETFSKLLENEIPVSVASPLKLAGCNIYGRMYRVGRIITELSGPCLECRCTEIGVQCKQLDC